MNTGTTHKKGKKIGLAVASVLTVVLVSFWGQKYFSTQILNEYDSKNIGYIAVLKNDARHKTSETFIWNPAQQNNKISEGDVIFSGLQSFTTVELKSGARLNIGESSLVIFEKPLDQVAPHINLIQGNFLVTVKGNTTLALRGKVMTLAGDNSKVQFYIDKNLVTKIKSIEGETKVFYAGEESYESLPHRQALTVLPDPEKIQKIADLHLPEDAYQTLVMQDPYLQDPNRILAQEDPIPEMITPMVAAESAPESVRTRPLKRVVKKIPVSDVIEQKESEPQSFPPAPEAPPQKENSKKFWLWLGVGLHYNSISQSSENYPDIEGSDLKGASLFAVIRGGFYLSQNWALDLTYRNSPGKVESDSTLASESYNWQSTSVDLLYQFTDSDWNLRLGAQQHHLPFIIANPDLSVSLKNSSLINANVGLGYIGRLNKNFKLEWILKYQYALSVSGQGRYSVKPGLSFENTLGLTYHLSKNTYFGIYWYTQYQNFEFDYIGNGSEFSGMQKFIFSNADARIGWEF